MNKINENLKIAEMLKNANVYTDISGKWIQSQGVENLIKLVVQDCATIIATSSANERKSIEQLLRKHFNLN